MDMEPPLSKEVQLVSFHSACFSYIIEKLKSRHEVVDKLSNI